MIKIRKMLLGIGAVAAFAASAIAADYGVMPADYGVMPADYESASEDYVLSRLADERGARFQFVSAPYPVFADFEGHGNLAAWAVDVRVRSRMASGRMGGYLPYTVIFVDGEPVAFEEDIRGVERVSDHQLVAQRG